MKWSGGHFAGTSSFENWKNFVCLRFMFMVSFSMYVKLLGVIK